MVITGMYLKKQGRSEWFGSCDWPSNLYWNWIQIIDFSACVTLKSDRWPQKIIGHLFYITSSLVHHLKSLGDFKLELLSGNPLYSGQNQRFFFPCELEIWWMTLKNNRAPLLCYIKLCASFQSHRWIQTGVTVQKRSIRVKIGNFFVQCDLEIWWMTLKTVGHICYAASSFVHHFTAISEFKLKL